ncbi:MAG: hypothetical protein RL588_422 [Pseudomonadota bacterium]|jgi:hypothetical protein
MLKLKIETATVRVAAFPEGDRLLTLRATCLGPAAALAAARLVPRRHASAPEDGLWDIDLVEDPAVEPGETVAWRDLVFIGEADWCEGVRLHSPGGVLEHRIAPQGARLAPRPLAVPRWSRPEAPPQATQAPRRRFDPFRVFLDGVAAAMFLAGLSLAPMALPANAAQPEAPASSGAVLN